MEEGQIAERRFSGNYTITKHPDFARKKVKFEIGTGIVGMMQVIQFEETQQLPYGRKSVYPADKIRTGLQPRL
jgi:hypothetical protein